MKIGIVVPYSWSFWGGVIEHATQQARALRKLGIETRILAGHDPPGSASRLLHPRSGRHDVLPPEVIPLGRSVIAPGNGSLPNIVISPAAVRRLRQVLASEGFDVLHIHEPLTPAIGVAALAFFPGPIVATFHAAGHSRWRAPACRLWGFLLERIDKRIAVSAEAEAVAQSYAPGAYELIPNGIEPPAIASPGGREHQIVFVGRHEPRKGLHVLLRAWPDIHRRTGMRLRVLGADPLAVRLLVSRLGIRTEEIDVLGLVDDGELERELLAAKAAVVPSLGNESFGMVITRALACATPVVASDIPGYRPVLGDGGGILVPPGQPAALADAVVELVADEGRRQTLAEQGRALTIDRYSWDRLAPRLVDGYRLAIENAAAAHACHDDRPDTVLIGTRTAR